jgi:hypothetical protein
MIRIQAGVAVDTWDSVAADTVVTDLSLNEERSYHCYCTRLFRVQNFF